MFAMERAPGDLWGMLSFETTATAGRRQVDCAFRLPLEIPDSPILIERPNSGRFAD